jgi:hypothetical protein
MLEHQTENARTAKVDVSALNEGIYLLRVKQKERIGSWKIQIK